MTCLYWLIPLFPLLGFLLNALLFRRMSGKWGGILASTSVLLSFLTIVLSMAICDGSSVGTEVSLFDWISAGDLHIGFSILIDPLSTLMILIITGVGFLIHVYSIGYMKDDEGSNRFFAFMNLFAFFMLLLVMASNYAVMFIGWEGVGLCSYLLIGFWYRNQEYNNAAKKAFIMNRIGDLGFLIGLFLMFTTFGSLDFSAVFSQAQFLEYGSPAILAITLLLFIGATGKSAQIPLFTWLPDAMAGPTPVSALIHAATMVTAGVYMVARSNVLYALAPISQTVIAATGIATAIMAATVALYQNDIKKVLAWSTISQLGLMFLALGTGSYVGAMFHLTTHAFFKALLFLGAGSVITFLHHEQDLRKMGGLKKQMPFTYAAFLIGTLAIAGIPPLAGFFSKDEILLSAYAQGTGWWLAAVATSILTAFYMFRLLYLAFHGNYRGDVAPGNMKPTPLSMKFALFVLAALAIIGGFLGLPAITGLPHVMEHYLEPVFSSGLALSQNAPPSPITEWILMAVVLLMICVAIYVAFTVFVKRKRIPDTEPRGSFAKLLTNKYYSDEAYDAVFVKPHLKLSEQLHSRVELGIIDRLVEEVGKLVIRAGNKVRYLQSGLFSFYLFIMVISIILILLFNLIL